MPKGIKEARRAIQRLVVSTLSKRTFKLTLSTVVETADRAAQGAGRRSPLFVDRADYGTLLPQNLTLRWEGNCYIIEKCKI